MPEMRALAQADIVLRLHPGHASSLADLLGARPHTEQWSKTVLDAIDDAFDQRRLDELAGCAFHSFRETCEACGHPEHCPTHGQKERDPAI